MRAQRKGKQHTNNLEHREKLGCIFENAKAEAGEDANSSMGEGREGSQALVQIPAVLARHWLARTILHSTH